VQINRSLQRFEEVRVVNIMPLPYVVCDMLHNIVDSLPSHMTKNI
jgi:hypothetical protein